LRFKAIAIDRIAEIIPVSDEQDAEIIPVSDEQGAVGGGAK
jgi:hypothetical protein